MKRIMAAIVSILMLGVWVYTFAAAEEEQHPLNGRSLHGVPPTVVTLFDAESVDFPFPLPREMFRKLWAPHFIPVRIVCSRIVSSIFEQSDDSQSKEDICQYVKEHVEDLSGFPYLTYQMIWSDEKKQLFIEDDLGIDTIVKNVYRYNQDILKFYCGGTGIVTSSTYSGFYFSKKDVPFALEFEEEAQFTQTGDGMYEWESEDGQKQVITERILPNWFYYYLRWD
ncbi:MAG: hypothetical protein QM271_07460 [Bacillota bacterium]|nr:hypothetical protein [Bacillota bacterium]